MRLSFALLPLAIAGLLVLPARAAESAPATPAADDPVSFEWILRLRDERVADDAFARGANVLTLRVRAGLRLRLDSGWHGLLEGEGIVAAGDGYNSGANGRGDRPLIADAEGAEINQAYLGWKNEAFDAVAGRQRLLFDNQRWIGNSGWRQNEQTFDALAIGWRFAPGWSARYAWLDRVHRVSGDRALDHRARERDLDTHLAEVAWKRGVQQLAGYAWLHEDEDVAAASTQTAGMRAVTDFVRDGNGFALTLEFARQRDHAGNPLAFSHRYWLVEPAYTLRGTTYRAGWEHLGGDGGHALQTPLATLHAFNGWADKFNATPPAGLEDRYLAAGGRLGKGRFDWQLAWHDYRADAGDARYGREWNGSLGFPVAKGVRGLVKLADYRADTWARDTAKAWVQLEWAN